MNIPFINLGQQYQDNKPLIDARIQQVLDHGQYIMGPEVAELEAKLAAYVGTKHCIGVADGTTALLIAMMALDIKPGDEVITTPFTFIATGEMISLLGAIPVYVDIESTTCNIDASKIEAAISDKTRAIIPVSLYGQCADMDAINAVADRHGLAVIEDGAQSFGARYKGKRSCGLSTVATTSFFPSKPLGCYGDGGACFTDDDNTALIARQIRVHGQSQRYLHSRVGMNGRLDTIQAAVLLAKFDLFGGEIERRQELAQVYRDALGRYCSDAVVLPTIAPYNHSVYAQFTVMVENRAAIQASLKERGIPTAVHYPMPLHKQELYTSGAAPFRQGGPLDVSESLSDRVMSLPFSPWMSETICVEVAQSLAAAIAEQPATI